MNNYIPDQILVILPENWFAFLRDEVVYCLLVYWLCGYECVHMCYGLWKCVCANIELCVCLDWRGYKQLCFYGKHKGNKFVFIRMCVSRCVTSQNWWTSVPTIWLNLLVPQSIIMYLINAKSFGDRFVYREYNWLCLTFLVACLISFGGFVVCDSPDESWLVLWWFGITGQFCLLWFIGFVWFCGLFLWLGRLFLHWLWWRFPFFWFLCWKLWSIFNICPQCVLQI